MLTALALKTAMVDKVLAIPGIVIDNMAELEAAKMADAEAIIETLTSLGQVIVPIGAIVTSGSAATQTGPAVAVVLTIT